MGQAFCKMEGEFATNVIVADIVVINDQSTYYLSALFIFEPHPKQSFGKGLFRSPALKIHG